MHRKKLQQDRFRDKRKQDNHRFAKQKPAQLKKQAESLDKRPVGKPYLFEVVRHSDLTKQQMLGFIFLLMLFNAQAINTPKKDEIREICQDKSRKTFNKPNISLGLEKGLLKPTSCITKGQTSLSCQQDVSLVNSFRVSPVTGINNGELVKKRSEADNSYDLWRQTYSNKIQKLHPKIKTQHQLDLVNRVSIQIDDLKAHDILRHPLQDLGGANCGEHTRDSIIKILQHMIKYNLKIKLQFVVMRSSTTSNYIKDHVYLLLNSNMGDIVIQNDMNTVKKFLKKIKKGVICDSWNLGQYLNFTEDKTGLYDSQAGWDNLAINTITLEIRDFQQLPKAYQKLFCKELFGMGLDLLEPRNACQQFKKKKSKCSGSVPTSSSQCNI